MIAAPDIALKWNLRQTPGRREWRGTCPACGYPTALVITERKGRALAWCASCDDRAALAALLYGMACDGTAALPAKVYPRNGESDARKRTRALTLWQGAAPCAATPAATYLTARGLPELAASPALRFRPDTPHPAGGARLALLALVQDVVGHPMALHRTYLRRDGTSKAEVQPNKASLGRVAGGAIRLGCAASEMVIGEGIETAASAGLLLGLPAWAAIGSGNLARTLALPPEVQAVVIAADADPPGRRAAEDAAIRWAAEGRRVRIALPDRDGTDFNDILLEVRNG